MIRAFEIAGVLNCGPKTSRQRDLCSLFSLICSWLLCLCLLGCSGKPDQEPIWEKFKIGDLAPSGPVAPQAEFIKTINLELHVIEIPADNIDALDKIRKRLHIKPLKVKNYQAFSGNSFLVRFGQSDMWNEVREMLMAADGQQVVRVALMLSDGEHQTLAVAGLSRPQALFYTALDGSRQAANIGPGILALRIRGDKIPGRTGICDIAAYPVFTLATTSMIPEFEAQIKRREFPFTAAAFGLRMSPGDFVFLAPSEHVSDQTALGGLFFSNVRGRMFYNRATRKPPEHKTAVRVFLLVCTRIDD